MHKMETKSCHYCARQYARNSTVITAFEPRDVMRKNHRPHAPEATPEVYV